MTLISLEIVDSCTRNCSLRFSFIIHMCVLDSSGAVTSSATRVGRTTGMGIGRASARFGRTTSRKGWSRTLPSSWSSGRGTRSSRSRSHRARTRNKSGHSWRWFRGSSLGASAWVTRIRIKPLRSARTRMRTRWRICASCLGSRGSSQW